MDGVSGIRTFVFSGKFVSLRKSDRGKTGFGTGRYWIPAAGWLLSLYERNGMGIREYYGWYLGYIFVPFLLVIQLFSVRKTGEDGRKSNCGRTCPGHHFDGIRLCGSRTGKRAYPLALGAGVSENGFVLKYAMPDMSTATGQENRTKIRFLC